MAERIGRLSKEWGFNSEKIIQVPKAVGSTEKIMFLKSEGVYLSSNQIVEDQENEEIEIVIIDYYFKEKDVTFIKADIEGAEYDMICGAERLIKRCKPKIAVCVYHKPDDLFRIYNKIKSLCNDYKFVLRQHAYDLRETVLYCWCDR